MLRVAATACEDRLAIASQGRRDGEIAAYKLSGQDAWHVDLNATADSNEDGALRFLAILALLASPGTAHRSNHPPKGSTEQRALFEKGQAGQSDFEQRLFVEAGFTPLADMASEKRAVIRALFESPYRMLPVSGVEIERGAGGSVTLTMIGRAGPIASSPLPTSTWSRLIGMQADLFEPRPYVPWDPPQAGEKPPAPPPICHGWTIRFGKSDGPGLGSASWGTCGGDAQSGADLAREIAKVAVATRPDCRFSTTDPFGSFSECFSPHR
ncbi:hypothetical protein BW41_03321 [Sphingomonas sp. RIT328]|nr:hypothetical protein BW41_03321 [Sphingomonas sp. RIT328]